MKNNICFVGSMGSGKTTLAKVLAQSFDYIHYSFAKEVKDIFQLIYQRPIDKAKDREILQKIGVIFKKKRSELERDDYYQLQSWINESVDFLKYYLNELILSPVDDWESDDFHSIHTSSFYLDKLLSIAGSNLDQNKVVVDDMRFLVESQHMSENEGAIIIRLDCDQEEIVKRLTERDSTFKKEWLDDVSEIEWKQIKPDFTIDVSNLSINEIISKIKSFNIL